MKQIIKKSCSHHAPAKPVDKESATKPQQSRQSYLLVTFLRVQNSLIPLAWSTHEHTVVPAHSHDYWRCYTLFFSPPLSSPLLSSSSHHLSPCTHRYTCLHTPLVNRSLKVNFVSKPYFIRGVCRSNTKFWTAWFSSVLNHTMIKPPHHYTSCPHYAPVLLLA